MKCIFCNAELLNGKDKCDYCGKYQHDHKDEQQNKNNEKELNNNTKNGKIVLTIIKTILCIAILCVGIVFVLKYFKGGPLFYGKWNCPSGEFVVKIDSSTFKIDYGSSGYEEANYILKEEKNNDDIYTFNLDVSATKTVMNGQTLTNKSNTEFQIDIDKKSSGTMILKNIVTNQEYKCYKRDE